MSSRAHLVPQARCEALTVSGEPCRGKVAPTERLCRIHMGKFAPPERWAAVLPEYLSKLFSESYDNPEVYSTRKELALIEAREVALGGKLKQIEEEDAEGTAKDLKISRVWDDMDKAMALKVKLADTHTKRMRAAGALFPASEVRMMLGQIVHYINEMHISAAERQAVLEKIDALLKNEKRRLDNEDGIENQDLSLDGESIPTTATEVDT